MKSAIIALVLTLIAPTFAQAKLTVFSFESAAKLVLNDSATMEKAKKLSNATDLVGLTIDSPKMNTFDVTLELVKLDYRCFVNVEVVAKGEAVILLGGGKIATNKLVVKSVKAEKCIDQVRLE